MLVFIIIASVMAYFVVGGVSYSRIQAKYRPICRYESTNECDADCGHSYIAALSTVFWPVIAPISLGISIGEREARIDHKHQRELDEAKHKVQLAKLRAEETAQLERALR